MDVLLLTAGLFLGTHLGVSSTPLRGFLIKAMGERAYVGLYSIVAIVTLVLFVRAYIHTPHTAFIWLPNMALHAFTKAIVPLGFILLVAGLMAKNPTAVMSDEAVQAPLAGILKITRHPVQWAILLWAVGHLVSNGDMASITFFGTFALLSAVGMAGMDARRRFRDEPAWRDFYATTSAIPFAALVRGKTSLALQEINWLAVAIGMVLATLAYYYHQAFTGVKLY